MRRCGYPGTARIRTRTMWVYQRCRIDTSDPRLPLALLPYALLAALAALALHRLLRRGRAALATGLALLVLPYLPACHVFVTVGFTVAERVLYLPSAGTCLLAAQPLCRLLSAWPPTTRLATPLAAPLAPSLPRRLARAAGLLLAAAALGGHAVLAVRRNNDWRTNLSLLTSGVAHQPTNAKLQYNLGRALYQLAVEHHPAHAAKAGAPHKLGTDALLTSKCKRASGKRTNTSMVPWCSRLLLAVPSLPGRGRPPPPRRRGRARADDGRGARPTRRCAARRRTARRV
mmetsp:Transcript_49041/g.158906  ORF Transcript_49041/g.158906 Transcript_49041/m.158906 type:complete len:287 (-) Transcript_49041:312-1172(-)